MRQWLFKLLFPDYWEMWLDLVIAYQELKDAKTETKVFVIEPTSTTTPIFRMN